MNLFPELDQSGKGKNIGALLGTPGLAGFITLGGGPIRGMFAGENRLFVASGSSLYEVFADGTSFNRGNIGNDGLPVTILANGTQLGIISAGQFYYDNGAGTVAAQFTPITYSDLSIGYAGTVSTISPVFVFWASGDKFNAGMIGGAITVNGTGYTVANVYDENTLALTAASLPNSVSPVAYTQGSVQTVWSKAIPFDQTDVGRSLTINGGAGFTPQSTNITAVDQYGNAFTSSGSLGAIGSKGGLASEALGPVTAFSGTFLDGYFIVSKPSTNLFYWSNLLPLGGAKWDAIDVAAKEGYPDAIARVFADHEELWIFGDEESTEIWQDTGAALSPFQRVPGAFMHYGCQAPSSVRRLNNGVMWIAADAGHGGAFAMWARGFQPTRVSTHAVEAAWRKYAVIQDAVAYSYFEQGHHTWVVSFPTANATWAFDSTTGFWHERAWFDGVNLNRHRAASLAYVALAPHGAVSLPLPPTLFVGDWQNGNVYTMSLDNLSDATVSPASTFIKRIRACPYISSGIQRIFFHRFWIDAQVAAGSDADSLNLQPVLDWSDDGGVTWSNTHLPRKTDYATFARLVFPRLGGSKFKGRVFRITITDIAPIALIAAGYDATLGQ